MGSKTNINPNSKVIGSFHNSPCEPAEIEQLQDHSYHKVHECSEQHQIPMFGSLADAEGNAWFCINSQHKLSPKILHSIIK